jgi:hypothetical protein
VCVSVTLSALVVGGGGRPCSVININRELPEDPAELKASVGKWTTNLDQDRGSIVGYAPFEIGREGEHLQWYEDPKWAFDRESGFYPENRFFCSGERQRLVKSLMNRCRWESPTAKFGVEHIEGGEHRYYFSVDLAEKGRPMERTAHPAGGAGFRAQADRELNLVDIFPLHCESERKWLAEHWGSFKLMTSPSTLFTQPLEPIRRYFGTHVGLYFAWLELYTKALVFPAVIGLLLQIIMAGLGDASPNELHGGLLCYSLFIAMWCTLFLEAWKRRENELKHDWGTEMAEEEEVTRQQFLTSAVVEMQIKPWGEVVKTMPTAARVQRACCSICMVLALCLAVGLAAALALFMKAESAHIESLACPVDVGSLDNNATVKTDKDFECLDIPSLSLILSYVGSLINLFFMYVFSRIYVTGAKFMTDAEVHRTETAYQDSLILKGFCFEFVNRYFLLVCFAYATAVTCCLD